MRNEDELDYFLSTPTPGAKEAVSRLKGDLLLLGVGGKMGPTLARMAKRAAEEVNPSLRVIGASRFSQPALKDRLQSWGVETISCDLLARDALEKLPDAENMVFMAGWKFGSSGRESMLWAMNTYLPALVAERFQKSRIVAFSTGNVYPFTPNQSGGPAEADPTGPVGEYAQSCLGRERMFQYFSERFTTPCTLIRLNYAVEMRYGVLLDIGQKIFNGIPIPLAMGYVNVIWQGDANAQTLQCFDVCSSPPKIMNITGPDVLPVRWLAEEFGKRLGREPLFEGAEEPNALLSNASQALKLFGPPNASVEQIIDWIVHWIQIDGPTLNKPTRYEGRTGEF
ncbi:MAG: NAD(P)-dependent oxidoreductase [Candidatus Omnitrophica bacterium]|nr:NAD(P)-dependent oxidoreductase [Candidatus Omnitrophota bacterium]